MVVAETPIFGEAMRERAWLWEEEAGLEECWVGERACEDSEG